MEYERLIRIFGVFAVASLLGFGQPAYAGQAEDNAALKQEVTQLKTRIAELEKQLGAGQSKSQQAPDANAYIIDAWDPFMEMEHMQRAMNRMFDTSFMRGHGMASEFFNPKVDMKETADQYVITMDLPGMDKNKIDVKIEGQALIVSGERSSEVSEQSKDKVYRQERSFGHFTRALALPKDAKTDNIDAAYNNGVLTIKLGRMAEKNGGKKVLIK